MTKTKINSFLNKEYWKNFKINYLFSVIVNKYTKNNNFFFSTKFFIIPNDLFWQSSSGAWPPYLSANFLSNQLPKPKLELVNTQITYELQM